MSGALVLFIPLVLYVVFLRPQRRRVQAQRAALTGLVPGDEVVTAGGLIGTLIAHDEDRSTVEVAPGVVLAFMPRAIVGRAEPAHADQPSLERAPRLEPPQPDLPTDKPEEN